MIISISFMSHNSAPMILPFFLGTLLDRINTGHRRSMMFRANKSNLLLHAAFFPIVVALAFISVAVTVETATGQDASASATQILEATGVEGGFVVHLGCGDGRLTAALMANDRCLVHGLDTDVQSIERARENILAMGRYGGVSVAAFDGQRLPYADNMVNLVVAEHLGNVGMDDIGTEDMTNALVAQTNAQDGNFPAKTTDDIIRDSCFKGRAWSR